MIVLLAVWLLYSQKTGSTIMVTHPKLTTFAYGGQFLNAVHRLQVANVTDEIPIPYRRSTFICWAILAVNGYALYTTGKPVFDELVMIVILNIIIWSVNAHYAYYVLNEMKAILGISVFTIKQKPIVDATSGKLEDAKAKKAD